MANIDEYQAILRQLDEKELIEQIQKNFLEIWGELIEEQTQKIFGGVEDTHSVACSHCCFCTGACRGKVYQPISFQELFDFTT